VKSGFAEKDFIRMFKLDQTGLPEQARAKISASDLTCRAAHREDLEEYVLSYLKLGEQGQLARTRDENLQAFERGWSENLAALRAAPDQGIGTALKPRYFRGSRFFRYSDDLVVTDNLQLEHDLFVIARLCLFHAYLGDVDSIVEIGSGSCANLHLLSRLFPKVQLMGLDWTKASTEIAEELGRRNGRKITGHCFDMFAPDDSLELPQGSAVITIHAFEQLGRSFEPMLQFLLHARPSLVVQYEPVLDFYDETKLLDYLALSYCKARSYLEGYYTRLRELEREGRVKLLAAYRPYLGGVLHEQSVLVWRPV
jgi:hypothetical protein